MVESEYPVTVTVPSTVRLARSTRRATVGVAYSPEDGVARDVRVAFGSLAPVPLSGRETEAALEGQALEGAALQGAAAIAAAEVSPISDIRGSAEYRRVLAGEFLRRLLDD